MSVVHAPSTCAQVLPSSLYLEQPFEQCLIPVEVGRV